VLLHADTARRQFSTFHFTDIATPESHHGSFTGGCVVTGESATGNIDTCRMGVCNTIITKKARVVLRLNCAWPVGVYREVLPNLAGRRVVAKNVPQAF
jgi:hypothetical protein